MIHLLLAVLGVIAQPQPALAEPVCQLYESEFLGRPVEYCLERTRPELPALPGEPVIYFFHPMGGSAQSWHEKEYDQALEALRSTRELPMATVVSFDTYPTSFFVDAQGVSPGPFAFESWFLLEFMPRMEREHQLCSERRCRVTAGMSMGGMGGLRYALKHPQFFKAAAVNCAALGPVGIYDPIEKWVEYFDRHPIGSKLGRSLIEYLREILPTQELADSADPIVLAERFDGSRATFPAIYFNVGDRDDFGFQEGAIRLAGLLQATGRPHVFELIPGATHSLSLESKGRALSFLLDQL